MSNKLAGRPIGFALIDYKFHGIISSQLQKIQQYLLESSKDVADRIIRDKLKMIKYSFGTPTISNLFNISLKVSCLAPGHYHPEISIENSKMIFTQ